MIRGTKKSPRGAEWELAYADRGVLPRVRLEPRGATRVGGGGRKPLQLARKLEVNV